MEAKKNRKYNLDDKRGLFFGIGLILSLAFVISAFEWDFKVEKEEITSDKVEVHLDPIIPPTEIPEPTPPKPKVYVKEFVGVEEEEEIEIEDFEIVLDQEELETYEPPAELEIEIEKEEKSDEVFLYVEKMPEPDGGYQEFYKFLGENLEYPQQARRLGIEGKVFIKFVVDEKGKLTTPEVVRGIGAGCDEEAVRVIKMAPAWTPGNQRGKNVKVQIILPVNFILHKKGVS